jgi:hypothetical protein
MNERSSPCDSRVKKQPIEKIKKRKPGIPLECRALLVSEICLRLNTANDAVDFGPGSTDTPL